MMIALDDAIQRAKFNTKGLNAHPPTVPDTYHDHLYDNDGRSGGRNLQDEEVLDGEVRSTQLVRKLYTL